MKTYKTKIFAAIHEMAEGMRESGAIDKKTMREFDESCLTPVEKLAPEEIRAIRDETLASQAVFARYLSVTPGLISQWERGEKSPSGPALKLLSLVKYNGLRTMEIDADDEDEDDEFDEDEFGDEESSAPQACAVAARYDGATGDLILTLRGGARLSVASRLLQGVAGADPQLIERVELVGDGSGLHWEELDADLLVPGLAAGLFGTRRWMAQLEANGLLDDEAAIERHPVDRIGAAKVGDYYKVSTGIQKVLGEVCQVTGREVGSIDDMGTVLGAGTIIGADVGTIIGRELNDSDIIIAGDLGHNRSDKGFADLRAGEVLDTLDDAEFEVKRNR